jgi:hypothetical protein
VFQHLGRLGLLQNSVLAVAEERFEDVLANGEADDQLLPREQRAVQESRKALRKESS